MNPFRVVGSLAVALALGLSSACGPDTGKPNSEKTKVGFVTNNPGAFWDIARAGAEQAAEEANVELVFRRPDKEDPEEQKRVITGVRDRGVKTLAVSVIDPAKEADFLDKVAADVPLLCVDNDAPSTKRLCYIGTDNLQAGQAAGRLVKEALPDGGKIAVFVGNVDSDNARLRRKGLIDELNGSPGAEIKDGAEYGKDKKYTLVKTFLDHADEADGGKAETNVGEALDGKELKDEANICLIGLYAYNTPKILKVVEAKGRLDKVKIVGFDEDEKTLQGIADGHVVGTVVQNPFQFGAESVKVMAAIVQGNKAGVPGGEDKARYINFRIVTKEAGKDYADLSHGETKSLGVKDFQDQLHQMLTKVANR